MSGSYRFHPATVHFPIAFWTAATVSDLLSYSNSSAGQFARVFLVLGALGSIGAIATGLWDASTRNNPIPSDESALDRHLGVALLACVFYFGSLFINLLWHESAIAGWTSSGLSVIGFVLLVLAGSLGGKMVHQNVSKARLYRKETQQRQGPIGEEGG